VLTSCFGIEVGGYACMINVLHIILKHSNKTAKFWSDEEVARRRPRLFPKDRDENGEPKDAEECLVEAIVWNSGLE